LDFLLGYYRFPFFFFPLSARGPTRRRNSTGLAELWGGWPIELGEASKIWEVVRKSLGSR